MATAIKPPHIGSLGSSLSTSIFDVVCLESQNSCITATVLFKKCATTFTHKFLLRWYINPNTNPKTARLKKR